MRKVFFTIFVFILLFVSACEYIPGGGSDGGDSGLPRDTDKIYRTGRDGLTLLFEKGVIPGEVYENSPFQVAFSLHNQGAYNIEKGYVLLSYEEKYIDFMGWNVENPISQLQDNKIVFDLKGKSRDNPYGEREVAAANLKSKTIGRQLTEDNSVFTITSCYAYKTIAETDVCIDTTDPSSLAKKGCEIEDVNLMGGQGAPVAVTKIEVRKSYPDSENKGRAIPEFKIYIQNQASGGVVNLDSIEPLCGIGFVEHGKKDLYDVVNIKAYLNEKPLECLPDNKETVKLKDEKGEILCRLNEGVESDNTAYDSPLRVELEYGYKEAITKTITIKRGDSGYE